MSDYSSYFGSRTSGLVRNDQGLIVDTAFQQNRSVQRFKEASARNGFTLPWVRLNADIAHLIGNLPTQIPLIAIPATPITSTGGYDFKKGVEGVLCMTQDYFIFARGPSILNAQDNFLTFVRARSSISDKLNEVQPLPGLSIYESGSEFSPTPRFYNDDETVIRRFCMAVSGELYKAPEPPPAPLPRPPL